MIPNEQAISLTQVTKEYFTVTRSHCVAGAIVRLGDGPWLFKQPDSAQFMDTQLLRAIADKLDEMNGPMDAEPEIPLKPQGDSVES